MRARRVMRRFMGVGLVGLENLSVMDDDDLGLRGRICPHGIIVVLHHGGVGCGNRFRAFVVGFAREAFRHAVRVRIAVLGSLVSVAVLSRCNPKEGCGDGDGEEDGGGGFHGTTLKDQPRH